MFGLFIAVWTTKNWDLIHQQQQNGIGQVPLSYKEGYWVGKAENLGENQSPFRRIYALKLNNLLNMVSFLTHLIHCKGSKL